MENETSWMDQRCVQILCYCTYFLRYLYFPYIFWLSPPYVGTQIFVLSTHYIFKTGRSEQNQCISRMAEDETTKNRHSKMEPDRDGDLDFLILSLCCCSGIITNRKCRYFCRAGTWDSTINYHYQKQFVEISIRRTLFTFILWVHFRAYTLLLLLEWRRRTSASFL